MECILPATGPVAIAPAATCTWLKAYAPSGSSSRSRRSARARAIRRGGASTIQMMSNDDMNFLMDATVDATEEAIINALIAARTMVGLNGNTVYAIPHDQVRDILKKYGRLR